MPAPYLNTLRYWFDVEALMYPDIPKPGKRPSFHLRYADQLPWACDPKRPRKPEGAPPEHKYFVYFGLVEKKVLEAELIEMFRVAPEPDSYSGNHVRVASGNTFLCAIEVTEDGLPLVSTLQLAAYAVSFAERKNQTRIGYGSMLAALRQRVLDVTSNSPAGIADADWFDEISDFLIDELNWQPRELLARAQLCAQQVRLLDEKGEPLRKPPEMEPINSFYLDDLERIKVNAQTGSGSRQIIDYLACHPRAGDRVDVATIDAANAALAARKFPAGRWPTKFPLFLMQQVAVNTCMAVLADGGVFSVNGPPGTGKTTLLMDVIAARIVERAKVLSTFERPEQAFSRCGAAIDYPPNADGVAFTGTGFLVDERLRDFGMVVASANNKAVENITLDLPNLEKVHPQPLQCDGAPFDYFSATAATLLQHAEESGEGTDDDEEAQEPIAPIRCWGLISVSLGNKKNRRRVVSKLGRFGERPLAEEIKRIVPGEADWGSARSRFDHALARVVRIQDQIAQFDAVLLELTSAQARLEVGLAQEADAFERHRHAQTQVDANDGLVQDNDSALTVNMREREVHMREWPWWRQLLTRLLQRTRFEHYLERRNALSDEYDALRRTRGELQRARVAAVAAASAAALVFLTAQNERIACGRRVDQLEQVRLSLEDVLGTAAFDPVAFANLAPEEQQKTLPRTNAIYQAARADVFVAAMHLHKAFLKHAGKGFETNFRLALSMLAQDAYITPHLPQLAPHLWASFFLAIPVVSSTFASVSRCFSDLGEGQIGLLMVDEAGQAVPSHALGAIWRSRRALIVGDPLQVEPVIKMDKKLDFGMLVYHGAPEEHMLTAFSAQHLADRGNRHGATLRQYDGSELWVGSPLRVHRRCVEPMFSLANQIAYNGKMVFGPDHAEEQEASIARPLFGASRWIDLVAVEFDEHFSAEEGKAAVDIVIEYARRGWIEPDSALPQIFLITPFKSVADGLQAALRGEVSAWAPEVEREVLANWLKGHVGTVHTFQGKECESVVFVLGGKTAGAREWAGRRPNIINVAVTRAKRRLYVIGNRASWSKTVFGQQLALMVPT